MPDLYVANTDNDWFDFLRARQPWEEINFWKPSQTLFKAIDEGGLFVFRLKAPRNVIGGYGILVSSINAPIKLAWESIGEGNGVASVSKMVEAIARYRKSRDTTEHSMIGCRLLSNPVFFDESEWFDVPKSWSQNIVTGKVYNTRSDDGADLFEKIEARNSGLQNTIICNKSDFFGFNEPESARYGAPILIEPRLGQASFRMKISSTYEFTCAVSGTRVLPALDAAHIQPYADGGPHRVENGILLRKDIHSVFDAGFATFDEEYRFIVSDQVATIFNNGNEYKRLSGHKLRLPKSVQNWPSQKAIRWHRENRYVGD